MRLQSVTERIAFFVTLLAVLVLALLPAPRLKEFGLDVGFHNDRLNHATAFAVLTFFGSLSWPERKATLVLFLALVGAVIEVLQGTALIGRDFDGLDWAVDCAGIACAMIVVSCVSSLVGRAT
ncbi:MAG: hypothetical protein E5V18_00485 [Mesorhizobium sp.]|nr:MAG: hypothetical protein EOS51_24125 [Mesorhizobium sp.]TGT95194.1 hypothetical protein EN807_17590 [Mesorhizobium sp. M5C.F.Ca.ET.164.01.1.1]RWD39680.1 MAG: hypothetical protein EOS35_33755 [Mesorhizobium sp.]TIS39659.1 MAG: hypothetical protein E5W95_14190 [Mesorhizobium sp.]TIU27980.1 MAG: hypothetical protein E5W53_00770 [Mesorhizobium sp.]